MAEQQPDRTAVVDFLQTLDASEREEILSLAPSRAVIAKARAADLIWWIDDNPEDERVGFNVWATELQTMIDRGDFQSDSN